MNAIGGAPMDGLVNRRLLAGFEAVTA